MLCLWVCFQKRVTFKLVDSVKKIASTNAYGHHSICERLNSTESQREGEFASFAWAETYISSCPQTSEFLVLRPLNSSWWYLHYGNPNFAFGLKMTSLTPLILMPFWTQSELHNALPCSSGYRWQIMGLFYLQYQVSQFPIVNLPI